MQATTTTAVTKVESTVDPKISIHSVIRVLPSYQNDALVNFFFVLPAIPTNIFALYIAWTTRTKKEPSLDSAVGMLICQLHASVGFCTLAVFYTVCNQLNINLTVLACSAIRRITGATYTPAQLCMFVVSTVRYASIIWDYQFQREVIITAYILIFVFAHVVWNTIEFVFGEIAMNDICGPTLTMPHFIHFYLRIIITSSICIALILDFRILCYLKTFQNVVHSICERHCKCESRKELSRAIWGFILQTSVPFLCIAPQHILEGIRQFTQYDYPIAVWVTLNGATCLGLTTTPLLAIIFIKNYRLTTLWLFRRQRQKFLQCAKKCWKVN